MRGIKIAILLVILLGFVFAQAGQMGEAEQTLRDALPDWLPLLAVAIFIGYGIVAIVYMIARVFKVRELEAWAKTNVGEVTGSIFLVAIILIVLGVADLVFAAVMIDSGLCSKDCTPYDVSVNFMQGRSQKLLDVYIDGVWLSTAVGSLSGTPLQYSGAVKPGEARKTEEGSGGGGTGRNKDDPSTKLRILIFELDLFNVGYRGFYGGQVFLTNLGSAQNVVLSATFISLITDMFISFVKETAIPVMIPFGMLLSSFSVTRKIGRTLIAFGVGLYLFVPVSILITEQMFNSAYFGTATNPPEIPKPGSMSAFTTRVLANTMTSIFLKTSAGILTADDKGVLPFQLTCIPICGVIAAACLIGYAACFAGCFVPCYNLVMPTIVYPALKTFGEIGFKVLEALNDFQLINVLGSDPAAYGMSSMNTLFSLQKLASFPQNPASGIAGMVAQYYKDSALNAKLAEITLDYLPYILQYAIPIILTPIIILIIVITAIRSLSPAIGGEIQILGVSELI